MTKDRLSGKTDFGFELRSEIHELCNPEQITREPRASQLLK